MAWVGTATAVLIKGAAVSAVVVGGVADKGGAATVGSAAVAGGAAVVGVVGRAAGAALVGNASLIIGAAVVGTVALVGGAAAVEEGGVVWAVGAAVEEGRGVTVGYDGVGRRRDFGSRGGSSVAVALLVLINVPVTKRLQHNNHPINHRFLLQKVLLPVSLVVLNTAAMATLSLDRCCRR